MKTRNYRNSDLKSINKWLTKHGGQPLQAIDLPSMGFVVPGVAAGFVRVAEGGVGVWDGLFTNSMCSAETRHKGISAVVATIISKGPKTILAFVERPDIMKRATDVGFHILPHQTIVFSRS